MKKIIEVSNLTKSYWKNIVLDWVNLNLEEWSIYGLLWPNGAWKTTTLKILAWLVQKSWWSVKINWNDWEKSVLNEMWVLIEQPILYEKNTWIENLKIHSLYSNVKKERIKEVLEIVWLDEKASKKLTKQYSLWMKQRLWIAIALLHNPKIVILDEPTNWLDIEWIIEIRDLILDLAKKGTSIIISSHTLSEIEKICTHIWIISRWKTMYENTKEEFMKLGAYIEAIYLSLTK